MRRHGVAGRSDREAPTALEHDDWPWRLDAALGSRLASRPTAARLVPCCLRGPPADRRRRSAARDVISGSGARVPGGARLLTGPPPLRPSGGRPASSSAACGARPARAGRSRSATWTRSSPSCDGSAEARVTAGLRRRGSSRRGSAPLRRIPSPVRMASRHRQPGMTATGPAGWRGPSSS